GRKLLPGHIGVTLATAAVQERTNASPDLPLLLGPAEWLPVQHQIAKRLDPLVSGGLSTPQIEKVEVPLRVKPDNQVDRVVPAIGRNRIVGSAVHPQRVAGGHAVIALEPFRLEVIALLGGWALLVQRGPITQTNCTPYLQRASASYCSGHKAFPS